MLPKLSPGMEKLPAPNSTRYADQIPRYFKVVTTSPSERRLEAEPDDF
jgi:hypothetical protein